LQLAAVAASITNAQAMNEDIDQDGEDEYLLFNGPAVGAFERVPAAAWSACGCATS